MSLEGVGVLVDECSDLWMKARVLSHYCGVKGPHSPSPLFSMKQFIFEETGLLHVAPRHDWPLLDALASSAAARCNEFEGQDTCRVPRDSPRFFAKVVGVKRCRPRSKSG